jgi:hypothetical protein
MKDRTAKTSSKTIRPLWADIHKTVENLGKSIGYQKTTLSDSGSLCSEKTWLCFAGLHLLYSEVTHKPHNVKHEHWWIVEPKSISKLWVVVSIQWLKSPEVESWSRPNTAQFCRDMCLMCTMVNKHEGANRNMRT